MAPEQVVVPSAPAVRVHRPDVPRRRRPGRRNAPTAVAAVAVHPAPALRSSDGPALPPVRRWRVGWPRETSSAMGTRRLSLMPGPRRLQQPSRPRLRQPPSLLRPLPEPPSWRPTPPVFLPPRPCGRVRRPRLCPAIVEDRREVAMWTSQRPQTWLCGSPVVGTQYAWWQRHLRAGDTRPSRSTAGVRPQGFNTLITCARRAQVGAVCQLTCDNQF